MQCLCMQEQRAVEQGQARKSLMFECRASCERKKNQIIAADYSVHALGEGCSHG